MLTGDHGDNIKGIKGLGPKKGEAILKGKIDLKETVINQYKGFYGANWETEYKTNYRLLGLGKNVNQ
jgi:5'-3' exonuclease